MARIWEETENNYSTIILKSLIFKKQNSTTKINADIHTHKIWEIFSNLNFCLFYYNGTSLIFIHLHMNHCCESILFQINTVLVISIALFPKNSLKQIQKRPRKPKQQQQRNHQEIKKWHPEAAHLTLTNANTNTIYSLTQFTTERGMDHKPFPPLFYCLPSWWTL